MKEQDSQWYNNKEKIPHVYNSEHSLTYINSIHCRMLESEQECRHNMSYLILLNLNKYIHVKAH